MPTCSSQGFLQRPGAGRALVGTVVAITSAMVGVFTVTRGQSFAGHSLADVATTGGSGAFLIGVDPSGAS